MLYRESRAALRALTALAASQGGYFTARQAAEAGYGASHLTYHVQTGNFERAGRGLYRVAMLPLAEHDDLIRLWLWSRGRDDRPQAVVSHQTALSLHDLAEFIPTTIHLTVPPGFRRRPPAGCVLHKGQIGEDETQPFDAVPVTTPRRTLRDLSDDASLPTEQFEQAVERAVQEGLIQRSEADELLQIRRRVNSGQRDAGTE